ncbi:Plant UBX domain-containing protein 1 [Castilleja foliolosa]|uniref:Plant UBX domain-containing protein 1 n=1 Tax=Castilleja foliolosa TaxID=1961234 RepID=A0ABD3DEX6_9LAMI
MMKSENRVTSVYNVVDFKSKLNLPREYCCNAILGSYVSAKCDEIEKMPFWEMVKMVQEGLGGVTDEFVKSSIDWMEINKDDENGVNILVQGDAKEMESYDYAWILSTKEDEKIRSDARAVVRVHFPDNHTLEFTFHPWETIQTLVDVLNEVISRPDVPFHLFTTPPSKPKKQLNEFYLDFYCVGLVPCGVVYFQSDVPKGSLLKEDVTSLF